MSIEMNLYTTDKPLKPADVIALGAKEKLELRFVIPFKCVGLDEAEINKPFKKKAMMIYCWPMAETAITQVLDEALIDGDTKKIMSVQDQICWFDFRCEKYNYETFWKKYADERDDFEKSVSHETLGIMKGAKVRYYFRCGFRPPRNAECLSMIAKMLQKATNGFLGE